MEEVQWTDLGNVKTNKGYVYQLQVAIINGKEHYRLRRNGISYAIEFANIRGLEGRLYNACIKNHDELLNIPL